MAGPLAHLITFTCYGSHLHGAESGSVDRNHNVPGTPLLPPNPVILRATTERMNAKYQTLSPEHRATVLAALQEVCTFRHWRLLAAHVRTNHVHVVLESEAKSERILHDLKAHATRRLNELEQNSTPRWARHGSTRTLWNRPAVAAAVNYVVEGQGDPMAVYVDNGTAP